MNPYQKALDTLKGRSSRVIHKATKLSIDANNVIRVTYRDTDVVTLFPNGQIVLDTGGWPSQTTQRRMDEWLPPNHYVTGSTLRNGVLPRKPREWVIMERRNAGADHVQSTTFQDTGDAPHVENAFNLYYLRSPLTGALGWGSNADDRVKRQMAIILPSAVLPESEALDSTLL